MTGYNLFSSLKVTEAITKTYHRSMYNAINVHVTFNNCVHVMSHAVHDHGIELKNHPFVHSPGSHVHLGCTLIRIITVISYVAMYVWMFFSELVCCISCMYSM